MSIFEEQVSRKPDNYPWSQDFIAVAQAGAWSEKEFNFQSDLQDFKVKLTDQEREIIIRSLSLIGTIETKIKKFWVRLGDNCPQPSLWDLGIILGAQEVVHGDAYEKLLEVIGIHEAFDKILELDFIKGRMNYLSKHSHKYHTDNKKQFVYSLILFTLFMENIALFSQFYTVSWFGKFKNLLKDTNKQIEYTSREEDLHAKVGIKLINTIRSQHPELFDQELEDKILSESRNAIKYECEIVEWIVNGYDHEHLNSNLIKNFLCQRMNESLSGIGYPAIFEVDSELNKKTEWFYEQLLGNNMTDFFHGKPVEYSKHTKSFNEEDLF